MNARHIPRTSRPLLAVALSALLLATAATALAAPGAHGPNGEHLDGPAAARATSVLPRVESKSEAFELVAELRASALVIMIDRFETNEPVLGANVVVESGALKAVAAFRAEQGDYVVSDVALLKALASPGEHGLVFTLIAGKDSDLLDGTLAGNAARGVAAVTKNDHGHAHDDADAGHRHGLPRVAWVGAGVATLGLMGLVWWRRANRRGRKLQGGL